MDPVNEFVADILCLIYKYCIDHDLSKIKSKPESPYFFSEDASHLTAIASIIYNL